MTAPQWSPRQCAAIMAQGLHKSAKDHVDFLQEEYMDMIRKGHCTNVVITVLLRKSFVYPLPLFDQRKIHRLVPVHRNLWSSLLFKCIVITVYKRGVYVIRIDVK